MAKNNNLRKIAFGAAGVALAAAAAAAGAVLSNKDLRKKLGKRATKALEVVNKLAQEFEKGAQGTLRVINEKTKKSKILKKLPKPKTKRSSKK